MAANVEAFVFVAEFEIRPPEQMLNKDIKVDDKNYSLIYNVQLELKLIEK